MQTNIASNAYVQFARPWQWTKNLLCLAGALFTLQPLTTATFTSALLVTFAFCMLSSAIYVFNDLVDSRLDALHPKKRNRPLPSGLISVRSAVIFGLCLLVIGIILIVATDTPGIAMITSSYLILNIAYTLFLKNIPLVDVFCISIGFLMRLLGGVFAVQDAPTAWIVACTFFLTLFLGFTKRRSEIVNIGSGGQRPVLYGYNIDYLDSLINATATMSIVSYSIFTLNGGRDPTLVVTILPVVFGIFYYQRITHFSDMTDSPDIILLKDKVLIGIIACWVASFMSITHFAPHFFR